jgi:Ca2+-transporting ATPase
VGNLALILVNRSWRLSIWRSFRERKNRTLKWILTAAGVLLVVLLSVPPLRDSFHFGPMRLWDWAVAFVAECLGVAWFEACKACSQR